MTNLADRLVQSITLFKKPNVWTNCEVQFVQESPFSAICLWTKKPLGLLRVNLRACKFWQLDHRPLHRLVFHAFRARGRLRQTGLEQIVPDLVSPAELMVRDAVGALEIPATALAPLVVTVGDRIAVDQTAIDASRTRVRTGVAHQRRQRIGEARACPRLVVATQKVVIVDEPLLTRCIESLESDALEKKVAAAAPLVVA